MAVDSLTLLSAGLLFAASIGAWILTASARARQRLYLRFAAVLLAALALSAPLGLSSAAGLFLLPQVSAALMIGTIARFARPLPVPAASLALITGFCGGLVAMLWGAVLLALAPMIFAGLAIIGVALSGIAVVPVLAGASLLAAGLVLTQQDAGAAMLLFSAAALIGLAKPVTPEKSALAIQH